MRFISRKGAKEGTQRRETVQSARSLHEI